MKKIILVILVLSSMAVPAFAGCYLGVTITPDPSGAADDQELWANPDGVVDNGDEYLGATLAPDAVSGNFLATPDCTATPAITLYIKTHFPGVELISNEVAPTDIVPAVIGLALKHQQ